MSSRVKGTGFPNQVMASRESIVPPSRLIWLDITRLLCALLILGIHWLRACYKVQLFGQHDSVNLVMNYEEQRAGLGMLRYLLIAGTDHSVSAWLTNVVGILGGFGWEGVNALIIVSGFSLTIALKNRSLTKSGWLSWFRKRATRILVPFYLVAIPFLLAYFVLLAAVSHVHGAFAQGLAGKLHSLLQTPPLGVALSHTLLFDPFEKQWQPDFFAPAWWFIPSILLAYAVFPLLLMATHAANRIVVLVVAAAITILSYHMVELGIFLSDSWYYIILQECFNFTLGIVVGELWLETRYRLAIEKVIFGGRSFFAAFLVFVTGNVANWTPVTRPFSSMLFGIGLLVMITVIAQRLAEFKIAQAALKVDAYDLYLVHQPFAFPVALATKMVLHGYAVFFGWFLFLMIAVFAAMVLSSVQKVFLRPRAPLKTRIA